MWSRHFRTLNNMVSVGGSVDSVISSDTMSSVFARTIFLVPLWTEEIREQVFCQSSCAPVIFMNSVYVQIEKPNIKHYYFIQGSRKEATLQFICASLCSLLCTDFFSLRSNTPRC